MLIPKEAIEKAIAGGWLSLNNSPTTPRISWDGEVFEYIRFGESVSSASPKNELRSSEIALDPLFWSALGKELGWGKWPEKPTSIVPKNWEKYAEDFFHLILTNGDLDAFWRETLSTNK